jgi:hypothetical protein
MKEKIQWRTEPGNPVIRPGELCPGYDDDRAATGHVLRIGDTYRMYYWASVGDRHFTCMAESPVQRPNQWKGLGPVLGPQDDAEYNACGPSTPFVLPLDDKYWLMYFAAYAKDKADGKLPLGSGVAISEDGGLHWRYHSRQPILACDKPWDKEGTGSTTVLRVVDEFRMYYTAFGEYWRTPQGITTGHGELNPRVSIGYAVSTDGIHWEKPLDKPLLSPRGSETAPYEYPNQYEYIHSKPFVLREKDGYRMWVSTYGLAYRIRSLVSADGLQWSRVPSGEEGDLPLGRRGAFDDHQHSYPCVVKEESVYRLWYTGNRWGGTGIGMAVGSLDEE